MCQGDKYFYCYGFKHHAVKQLQLMCLFVGPSHVCAYVNLCVCLYHVCAYVYAVLLKLLTQLNGQSRLKSIDPHVFCQEVTKLNWAIKIIPHFLLLEI